MFYRKYKLSQFCFTGSLSTSGEVYEGTMHCLRDILRHHGVRGCYQGMCATMMREFPGFAVYITSYEYLCDKLTPDGVNTPVSLVLVAGGLSGMTSWMLNIPLDIIKTRLQEDNPSNRKYAGFLDCAKQSVRENSWKVFYRGLPIVCLRAFVINAATFAVYSTTLQHFN